MKMNVEIFVQVPTRPVRKCEASTYMLIKNFSTSLVLRQAASSQSNYVSLKFPNIDIVTQLLYFDGGAVLVKIGPVHVDGRKIYESATKELSDVVSITYASMHCLNLLLFERGRCIQTFQLDQFILQVAT